MLNQMQSVAVRGQSICEKKLQIALFHTSLTILDIATSSTRHLPALLLRAFERGNRSLDQQPLAVKNPDTRAGQNVLSGRRFIIVRPEHFNQLP